MSEARLYIIGTYLKKCINGETVGSEYKKMIISHIQRNDLNLIINGNIVEQVEK